MKNLKKGLVAGCWDLMHPGHILLFKECKKNCDWLVACLSVDPSIDRPNKNRPIESADERTIRLMGCKYIDEVIYYYSEAELRKIIQEVNPDIRFLGSDWKGKQYSGHDLPVPVMFIARDHNYSSSNLRKRICDAQS